MTVCPSRTWRSAELLRLVDAAAASGDQASAARLIEMVYEQFDHMALGNGKARCTHIRGKRSSVRKLRRQHEPARSSNGPARCMPCACRSISSPRAMRGCPGRRAWATAARASPRLGRSDARSGDDLAQDIAPGPDRSRGRRCATLPKAGRRARRADEGGQAVTPERVDQARFLLGWPVDQLARASALSPTLISAYEAGGRIHSVQLASIRKALLWQEVEFEAGRPVLTEPASREPLNAEQCRAARKTLGWSQRRLSAECGLPVAAITVFERSGSISASTDQARAERLAGVRQLFEAAGVEFREGNSPGVRLRKAER